MLNPPVGVTLADYIAASLAGNESHVKVTFLTQNVVLEDDDIEASGITISSVLNGDTNLTIGKAVSRELRIPIINSSKINGLIWTSNLKVEYGLKIGNNIQWITLGFFIGKRPERFMTEEVIDFTAMDYMQKFDGLADDWLRSLTYPMTTLQMLKSLCTYCGVGWTSGDELGNIKNRSFDSAPIQQTGLLCRDILAVIAEACGCYARINEDGNCQLVWFENHTADYTLTGDDEFPPVIVYEHTDGKRWVDLENFKWADLENLTWADLGGTINQFRIDAVNVKFTEDDIGIYYPSATNGNIYYIVDNPFLITAKQTEVVDYIVPIYTRLNNLNGYLPSNLSAVGCALIEAGDIINITANNETVRMPIFVKTMQWNGSLMDTMECTGDPITMRSVPQGIRERLSEGGRYHIFKNTVDELYSELYDPATGDVSVLKQIASGLGMSANEIDLQAGKKLLLESGADIEVKSGADINVTSGGNLSIVSGGTLDVDTTNFKINSTNKSVTAGEFTYGDNGIHVDRSVIKGGNTYNLHFVVTSAPSYSANEYYSGIIYTGDMVQINNVYRYVGTMMFVATKGSTKLMELLVGPVEGNDEVRIYERTNKPVELGTSSYPISDIYTNNIHPELFGERTNSQVGSSSYPFTNGYFDNIIATNIRYSTMTQISSKDYKHDIKPLPSVGDKLDRLEPVTFVYDEDKDEKTRHGLIYEDTIEVMPEICTDDESDKAINYVELIPMLLKEIQDLRARVKALEEREEQ